MTVYCCVWAFCMNIFLVLTDVRIDREQSQLAANRLHMACEAFGCGKLPQLQSAVYKVPPFNFLNTTVAMLEKKCNSCCSSSARNKIQRQRQQNHDRT